MNESIATELENSIQYLKDAREAINARGGSIDTTAGLKDLKPAILEMTADNAISIIDNSATSYVKEVPLNAIGKARISSIGGNTVVKTSTNLLEYMTTVPYYTNAPSSSPSYLKQPIEAGNYRFKFEYTTDPGVDGGDTVSVFPFCGQNESDLQITFGDTVPDDGFYFTVSAPTNLYFELWTNSPSGNSYQIGLYAMLYKVPDDSAEHIITTYEPYEQPELVPCAVTEVVSKDSEGNVLGTVTIPDAVKNLTGWGQGLRSAMANQTNQRDFRNTYDFITKEYTQWVSDKIVIDGINVTVMQLLSNVGGIRVLLNSGSYADYTAFQIPVYKRNLTREPNTAYIIGISEGVALNIYTDQTFATVDEANVWLQEHPTEVVYAFKTPILSVVNDVSAPLVDIEAGGSLTFNNAENGAVPSIVTFVTKVESIGG